MSVDATVVKAVSEQEYGSLGWCLAVSFFFFLLVGSETTAETMFREP